MRSRTLSDVRAGFSLPALLAVTAVILVAAAAGLGAAWFLTGSMPARPPQAEGRTPDAEPGRFQYIEFGPVVANLAEGRLTRYVKVNVTLQVAKEDARGLSDVIKGEKKALFQDWLLSYLSDRQLEEVRGGAALARLRRDIQDGFNALLAEHGEQRIEGVLFTEFNIQ